MKIETILNAMTHMALRVVLDDEPNKGVDIRHRQYHACRDRIIRLDERNKMRIAELEDDIQFLKDNWGLRGIIEEEYEDI